MHATVGDSRKNITRGVELVYEADLADRPKPVLEARHDVLLAEPVWNQIELRIFGGLRIVAHCHLFGIRDQEAS